jgi:tetratricopeptide (TPR) repeat protein
MIASALNYRAGLLFSIKDEHAAIDFLRAYLKLASQHGLKPQEERAHRLLGEALLRIEEKKSESLHHLQIACQEFQEMGMMLDLAETFVVLGRYYLQANEVTQAHASFEDALQLSDGTFHEVDWRAYEGLAGLPASEQDNQKRLSYFKQGLNSLAHIRDNFWQPGLAGSYLQTPSSFVNKAIQEAVRNQEPEPALQFIEENKASTLRSQLLIGKMSAIGGASQELSKVKAEINWLKDKLRESSNSASLIKNALQSREYRTQLVQKAKQYDQLVASLERRERSHTNPTMIRNFDYRVFRSTTNFILGRNWLALDYFLTDSQLNIILLSPDDFQVFRVFVSERFHTIL